MRTRGKPIAGPPTAVLAIASFLIVCALRGGPAETDYLDELRFASEARTTFSCGVVPRMEPPAVAKAARSAAVTPLPSAIGEKRILLYRVDFANSVGAAISTNDAAALILDLNNYYREMSYGLMTFAAVGAGSMVTETLRLPAASSAYDNNFTKLLTETRQAAAVAGYSPAQYDFDIVCTGAKPFLVFGALSYNGAPGIWVGNGNFNSGVVGHELGHNLGLPHASFWFTGDQSTVGPGTKEEYGDPYDSMGVPGGSASHFNTRFKNLLGWVPDRDAPVVTSNGTYRITAHDHPAASGLRALRIVRDETLNYWIEFRQSFDNRWVTNGAGLRWAGSDSANTLLLDAAPGTPFGKQDSTLLIGRTFSDRCIDLHITPVSKAGTTPESLNVVVNRGPFPGNVPPVVTVVASTTNVSSGSAVTLRATAADANGDSLAYYWDFGDGNFGGNQSIIEYTWPRDGEYVVRCAVTDLKGGTASATIVIRVGTVTTFVVTGRVFKNGAPMEGVLVKAGTSRFSYTDSDGAYRISRVNPGRQIMTAILERFTVLNAGFENPVTVGPNAAGPDFVAASDSLNSITLVAAHSIWKYLDGGASPANGWIEPAYDDTAWKTGPAKLGYGIGDEATTVSFGSNASDRHVTTWFRHHFVVEDAAAVDHLMFRLRRDDGAVVYLNGREVFRENLQAGEIRASTTALAEVNAVEEQTFFARLAPPTRLVTGANVLAVEVHQASVSSTSLSFDLELIGMTDNPELLRPRLALQHSGSEALLSWPLGYNGWALYSASELKATGAWSKSTASVIVSNGWNTAYYSPSNASGFYQMRKLDFCSPFR